MSEREYAEQGGGTEGVSRILERVGRREGRKRTIEGELRQKSRGGMRICYVTGYIEGKERNSPGSVRFGKCSSKVGFETANGRTEFFMRPSAARMAIKMEMKCAHKSRQWKRFSAAAGLKQVL